MQINEHPNYNKLKWVARWKIFNFTHARGFWWPGIPVLLAIALAIEAISPTPFTDYLLWFCLVAYVAELPLLVMLSRRAMRQSIGDLGISAIDIHHVREGLNHAGYEIITITDALSYQDFIVCNLVGELSRAKVGIGRKK